MGAMPPFERCWLTGSNSEPALRRGKRWPGSTQLDDEKTTRMEASLFFWQDFLFLVLGNSPSWDDKFGLKHFGISFVRK